jgi:hypothetical protein
MKPYETITSVVIEYACDLVESNSAKSLSVLRLAVHLRKNAQEIESGGPTAPEMEALVSAVKLGEELMRAVTDDLVSDEEANDIPS